MRRALHLSSLFFAALTAARDKVFFLGPMKTGTTSLSKLFTERGYKTCHGECAGETWSTMTYAHKADSKSLRDHDAFMDHGDHTDFEWLNQTYPTARFVLNTRSLRNWVVSKADHMRRKRVSAGCPPWGSDCAKDPHGFVSNSNTTIRRWIISQAEHQRRVLDFFNGSRSLRNRFVVVDVEGQSARSLNLLLDWVTRSDVSTRKTTDPVRTPKSVPLSHAVHHTEAPDANSNAHSSDTRTRVTDVLRSLRVPASCWEDTLYFGCLKGMTLTRSEVAKRHTGTDIFSLMR